MNLIINNNNNKLLKNVKHDWCLLNKQQKLTEKKTRKFISLNLIKIKRKQIENVMFPLVFKFLFLRVSIMIEV
jgi:hypothetical protein